MTTTGWTIWFACLGLGAALVVLAAWRISKGMARDQNEREENCIDCDRPMRDCS
jgi:hypothetical protein